MLSLSHKSQLVKFNLQYRGKRLPLNILRDRYFTDEPLKLCEIAAKLNISAERVRQIELEAIQILRTNI